MLAGGMSGSHHDVQVTATERKIVACWIDLCAPAAGTYSSHLTDAAGYEKLMEKRKKWAEVEAKNIKDVIVAPNPRGRSVQSARTVTEQFGIGYLSTQRMLVLSNPCEGNFILFDLRGTVISRMQIFSERMNGTISISLPASLSKGIYVARIDGVDGIRQTMISITK